MNPESQAPVTPPFNPMPPVAPAPAPAPVAAEVPSTPDVWPGAFGIYKNAKAATRVNLLTVVMIYVLGSIVGVVFQQIFKAAGEVLSYLINTIVGTAITITLIAGVRRQKLSITQALQGAFPLLWLKVLLLSLLVGLATLVSFLLFIIPAFFVVPRLVLAPYYLIDQKLGILEAFKASWKNSKGNAGKVYGINGAFIAMGLLAITIIGIPFAIYFVIMYSTAYAVLYEYVIKTQPAAPVAPQAPAAPVAPVAPVAPTPPAAPSVVQG